MIGGNETLVLEKKTTIKNEICEDIPTYKAVQSIVGFLDYNSGESKWTTYNAKIQESTHIFIADYVDIPYEENEVRAVINDKVYDVQLIDNPMKLNKHIEIYLKYIGE